MWCAGTAAVPEQITCCSGPVVSLWRSPSLESTLCENTNNLLLTLNDELRW